MSLPQVGGYPDASVEAKPPIAFAPGKLVIPAEIESPNARAAFVLYTTADGGKTWRAGTALEGHGNGWSMVSPQIGWVHIDDDSVIYVTRDGGRTWAPASGLKPFVSLQFVSANDGWAQTAPADLLRTTDGGAHWTRIRVTVPPA